MTIVVTFSSLLLRKWTAERIKSIPELRYGQAMYLVANDHWPKQVQQVMLNRTSTNSVDPFYVNENVGAFIGALQTTDWT